MRINTTQQFYSSQIRLKSTRERNTENLYFLLQLYAIYKAEASYKKLPVLPPDDPRRNVSLVYQPTRQASHGWRFSLLHLFSVRKIFGRSHSIT